MICPSCGNKPLSFSGFLVTLNPWRIRCVNCGVALRAGPIVWIWTALHILLGIAMVKGYRTLAVDGVIASPMGVMMFLIGVFGLLFVTAYVIPWMFFTNAYRAAD